MAAIATNLNAELTVALNWIVQQTVSGLAAPNTVPGQYGFTTTLLFGTGSGQATNVFFSVADLLGGTSETLDLYALIAPPSNLNVNFSFATVLYCVVELIANDDGSTMSSGIRIGNAPTNRWDGWLQLGGTFTIDSGGAPFVQGSPSGRAVTATARNLLITNLDPVNQATVRVTVYGIQVNP